MKVVIDDHTLATMAIGCTIVAIQWRSIGDNGNQMAIMLLRICLLVFLIV